MINLRKIFGIDDQTKLIEDKFNAMQEKVLAEVATLRNENFSLRSEISQKNTRITEILTKIRDQNEADLFLEIKKIEKRILEGEKKIDTTYMRQQEALLNMANSQLSAQRGNLGLLGGLGGAGTGIFR